MSQTHRYEIWWVDRAKAPDVRITGNYLFDDYHEAQRELSSLEVPTSGHFVIKRFDLNGPTGEIVHVDHRNANVDSNH